MARPERLSLCAEDAVVRGAALYTHSGRERLLLDILFEEAVLKGAVTSGWVCESQQVTRETAVQDLAGLVELGLLVRVGKGRGTRYEPGS